MTPFGARVKCVRFADGTPAVLKLARPGDVGAAREAAALECFGGGAAVAVLAHERIGRAGRPRARRPAPPQRAAGEGGWKAIDPKGVVAEPAYETGALLRNPLGAPLDRRRLARRIALLAEALELDRGRIHAWARVQAVLSAVWNVQDGEDPAFFLHCAELLG